MRSIMEEDIVKVDLNKASEEDLVRIPGMRPSMAAVIVSKRLRKRFDSVDDLRWAVGGIGDKTMDKIRPHLFVRPKSSAADAALPTDFDGRDLTSPEREFLEEARDLVELRARGRTWTEAQWMSAWIHSHAVPQLIGSRLSAIPNPQVRVLLHTFDMYRQHNFDAKQVQKVLEETDLPAEDQAVVAALLAWEREMTMQLKVL